MTNNQKIRLLLLSGGSLVGANLIDMCASRRDQLYIIATNSIAEVPVLYEFDKVYLTPPTVSDAKSFEEKILEIIETEKPDLIFPCRDDDIIFLASLMHRKPEIADRIISGPFQTAKAVCDKLESWDFSVKNNLPFVPTTGTSDLHKLEEFAIVNGFPLLAKPRFGFASKDVRILTNQTQLFNFSGREDFIIQKFIGSPETISRHFDEVTHKGLPLYHSFEGVKHSIQLIIGRHGNLEGYFCSRNINRNGTSIELEKYDGDDAVDVATRCYRAFSNAGWRGPLNIQCQKADDLSLWIYEFNGRISGASAARLLMDFDELYLIISSFLNLSFRAFDYSGNKIVKRRMIDLRVPVFQKKKLKTEGFIIKTD